MSYVLDGIETAYTTRGDMVDLMSLGTIFECPCGWGLSSAHAEWSDLNSTLRFHYMNCEQARVAPTERAEPE